MIHEFQTHGNNSITVLHLPETDGGGTWFGQEYVKIIKQRYPDRIFQNCYEWCAGPGFIGFAILANGLCERLLLSDIYDPAVELSKETARRAGIANRVESLLFRDLSLLPVDYQFDLVVANPPHEPFGTPIVHTADHGGRIEADPDWASHRNFFKHIGRHLKPGGIILLQENAFRGPITEFKSMIESNNLEITDHFVSPEFYNSNTECQIYYIEIRHRTK